MMKIWFSFINKTSNLDEVVNQIDDLNHKLQRGEITPSVVAENMKRLIKKMDQSWSEEWDNNPELKELFDKFRDVKDLAKSLSIVDRVYPSRKKGPASEKYVDKFTTIEKEELNKLRLIQNFVEFLYAQGTITKEEYSELFEDNADDHD